MIIVLIHWRIKPEPEEQAKFIRHWKIENAVKSRKGLVAEFLSDTLTMAQFPRVTWHLDPESTGDFKSYVTVGMWDDTTAFEEQIGQYFNDDKPMFPFEKYRRRRVAFDPIEWRIGEGKLPTQDSDGVL